MVKIYRGYVASDGKKSIDKFKNVPDAKLRTLKEVESEHSYAGVLMEDIVVIDVDDFEQSEKLMDVIEELNIACRVHVTTRGKHFIFKNNNQISTNRTNARLALGVNADIKIGSRNSYQVLKKDGIERKIIWDLHPDEELAEIPMWLLPVKTDIDFFNLEEGDGRNQTLFNYILTLQSNNFSKEEARETIRLINEHILPSALDESELDTILRDEAFQKDIFFKKNQFLFDKFSFFLKNNEYVKRVNNQLHIYYEGIYTPSKERIEGAMVKHISSLSHAKRREVLSYLTIISPENEPMSPPNQILFRNGVLDIDTSKLSNISPEYIITNKIPWDYNPNAYDELMDTTLNKLACSDPNIRMLLEELAGACLYRRTVLGKAFILTGEKDNGKSTYLDLLKTMLGDENIVALDLNELGERFKTAELYGKLANIGDDIEGEYINNTGIFKKLATGDRLNVERKGQDPFDFNNFAKLIFSANNIPRLGSGKDTAAVVKRLVIVPFDAKFSANDADFNPNIKYDLRKQQSMEYFIKLAIEGLKRVLSTNKFTASSRIQKEIEEYEVKNNPLLGFIQYCEDEDINIIHELLDDVYIKYDAFCGKGKYMALSMNEFSKQIQKQLNITTKRIRIKELGNKQKRVFVPFE